MSDKPTTRTYSNGDIEILWQPDLCIHSTKCFQALPNVFNPSNRPWVNMSNGETFDIIKTVKNCPSGALSLKSDETDTSTTPSVEINVLKDGPVLVKGNIDITISGKTENLGDKQVALCRCGHSNNKPYCDGNHVKAGFKAD
ncbi:MULTISPECIES: (4Fe-4S)-binding protein [Flammeovirga]|uniref:Iron-binding zinc finger CDGSH type domain-containing protein n=1 Tax=Flammeovirga agarivorans TaxID=2726742 RepID=A0A7X8XUA8_9BACT|nr:MULTISPECIES: (4Fe-4S)-binding protein [Flammeovirga]NLR89930.1 hypothetical protein [Flammeovirga agarivorans]